MSFVLAASRLLGRSKLCIEMRAAAAEKTGEEEGEENAVMHDARAHKERENGGRGGRR